MKATELIKRLQELVDEHGDLVIARKCELYGEEEVDDVRLEDDPYSPSRCHYQYFIVD